MRTFIVLFFKNTSPTEIYTSGHTLSYTTLFRSFIDAERGSRLAAVGENLHERAAGFLVVRVEQQKLPRDGGTALALAGGQRARSEEHTSELQSLMRNSYAVFCLKKHTNKEGTNYEIQSHTST